MSHHALKFAATISLAFASLSCSVLQDMQQAMVNIARLKFKLAGVSNFELAGVPLAGKASYGLLDGANLLSAFGKGSLPASFTLQIAAINPNDGTAGTRKSAATLAGLDWTLLIDNTRTIDGSITTPLAIPATGEQVIVPLRMNIDLVSFFKDKGYDHILKLALALGGASGSPSRLTLRARPTVQTEFGPISYPGEIDIVDKEYR
jgi:hypothetical protein